MWSSDFLQVHKILKYFFMGALKFMLGLSIGFYTGTYLVQNYKIPNIPAPGEIYNSIKKVAEKYKKDRPDDWFSKTAGNEN